jgi:hAT family C-terminal dimerisation region
MKYIIKIADRIIKINARQSVSPVPAPIYDDDFEIFGLEEEHSSQKLERSSLISQLTLYNESQERLPRESNVLEFWAGSMLTQLSWVANILLATPATQVSVERLFSLVKFVFSPLRARIGGSLLADIVFVKANKVNFTNN